MFWAVAIFLTVFCASDFGQESYSISEREYYAATFASWQKTEEKSRRVESNDTSLKKGVAYRTDQNIWEYSGPDRKRSFWRQIEGGRTTERERIEIGDDLYVRENGGAWTKNKVSSGSGIGGIGSGVSEELTQTTKQFVTLNGASAYLYSLFRVVKQPLGLIYYETKVWIGLDELKLQEERSSGTLYPKIEDHHEITTYTYDPKIKIEAPIK